MSPFHERTNNWLPPANIIDPSEENIRPENEPSNAGCSCQACPTLAAVTVPIIQIARRNPVIMRLMRYRVFMVVSFKESIIHRYNLFVEER
jgi:hypothetical protein